MRYPSAYDYVVVDITNHYKLRRRRTYNESKGDLTQTMIGRRFNITKILTN